MITLHELQAAFPAKTIIFEDDIPYYPNDMVTLPDGDAVCLNTTIHMTFLKTDVASEYFHMMILNRIGESRFFKDDSIKTVVIANARTEEKSKLEGFLTVVEGEKSITYTFLAGGR